MAIAEALLTAREFARRADPGHPEELVRGRIVPSPPPNRRHGQVCAQAVYLFRRFLEDHDLGHILSNDAGVFTEQDPDTVRGPDIAFYSYAKLPRGPLPADYGPELPELVVEVRSPGDRWPRVLAKVAEYLDAGVVVVCVLDPETGSARLFHADGAVRTPGPDDELTIPEVLGDFRVPLRRFFE